jgi:hypothetical protein
MRLYDEAAAIMSNAIGRVIGLLLSATPLFLIAAADHSCPRQAEI